MSTEPEDRLGSLRAALGRAQMIKLPRRPMVWRIATDKLGVKPADPPTAPDVQEKRDIVCDLARIGEF